MPQRDTVAGDATRRSIGSNIMLIKSFMAMISPDMRQSFLLSSNTCTAAAMPVHRMLIKNKTTGQV